MVYLVKAHTATGNGMETVVKASSDEEATRVALSRWSDEMRDEYGPIIWIRPYLIDSDHNRR